MDKVEHSTRTLCVLLPIHVEDRRHWTLGVIFAAPTKPKVLYLDSLEFDSDEREHVLLQTAKHLTKTRKQLTVEHVKGLERQSNDWDCGLFVLDYMESVINFPDHFAKTPTRTDFKAFSEADMPAKRR